MRKIIVLAAAAVFVLGLSPSSWAVAEFDFGASINTNIQYNSYDDDWAAANTGVTTADGYGDTTLSMNNAGKSRLYVNGTLDDFSSRLEIRVWDGRQIRADRASATWNFSEGMYFLFGFDSDLVDLHWSDAGMNDSGNYGFGAIGDNKQTQIQLGGSTETFTWGVDLAQTYTADVAGTAESIHAVIPRIEGIVKFAAGEMFDFGASAWYNTFELINDATFAGDESVNEFGFNGRVRYFSDFVNIGVGGFWGQNLGISGVDGHPGNAPVADGTSLEDATSYGIVSSLSFPIEPVVFGIGGGFETAKRDVTGDLEDTWTRYNFYVNVLYSFTDNFTIAPEFWYADYGDSYGDVDQGTEWVIGAKLVAAF